MMLASVKKSSLFFSDAPDFRVFMATVRGGLEGRVRRPLQTSPNSPRVLKWKNKHGIGELNFKGRMINLVFFLSLFLSLRSLNRGPWVSSQSPFQFPQKSTLAHRSSSPSLTLLADYHRESSHIQATLFICSFKKNHSDSPIPQHHQSPPPQKKIRPTSPDDGLYGDEVGVNLLRELTHGHVGVLVCVRVDVSPNTACVRVHRVHSLGVNSCEFDR